MPDPRLGSILALAFLLPVTLSARDVSAEQLSPEQWREDLRFVVDSVREIHPKPFLRTTEAAFSAEVADLVAAIPDLDDDQIVIRLMRLVAGIGDGHTALVPAGPQPIRHAYPLRLHRFHDGVYVVYIGADLAHLAGGRVLRIGDVTIEDAVARVEAVTSGDSELGKRWPASLLFTMPHVLYALGITSSPLEMSLTVVTPDGLSTETTLAAVEPEEPFQSWYLRMFGGLFEPPPGVGCVDAFGGGRGDLPPHLAGLLPRARVMWFEHLKRQQTLYVQLNVIDDTPEETFAEFNDRLWEYFDTHAPAIEDELNALGYEMLEAGRVDDAIAAFELNTERHPDSSNALDSLAEGYYRKGDLDSATQLYRASLGLDPGNEDATRMLEKIRGEGGLAPAS